jgi:hypothetical protein
MTDQSARAARVRAVPVAEPPPEGRRSDYADAFEVRVTEPDARTAEQWARCALEQARPLLRRTVLTAHRHLLRFRLGPLDSPDHVLGWTIVTSEPDVIRLEASSPVIRGVIIGRRSDPTTVVLTTFVRFERPAVARVVWAIAAPLHRRVARELLVDAAEAGRTAAA